jgi:predicted aconitase with swiveling domain
LGEIVLHGRVIQAGQAQGQALVSAEPVSFLGGVDPDTGLVVDPQHSLAGSCVRGRVLVFPMGKGSTVGSYVLYQLAYNGLAPAALINVRCEAIVAVGAIIAGIPAVDRVDITQIASGDWVRIEEGGRIVVRG